MSEKLTREAIKELGFNPKRATKAAPGSPAKMLVLEARYRFGLNLWHEKDYRDHECRSDLLHLMGVRDRSHDQYLHDWDDDDG